MSRALATAGSAVVFAGATVIIALCGLAVARHPGAHRDGSRGAPAAVTVAVLVALTLVPAIGLLFGERMRPERAPRGPPRGAVGAGPGRASAFADAVGARVTRVPVLTVVVVVGLLASPPCPPRACGSRCPTTARRPTGPRSARPTTRSPQAFGEGYNAPLLGDGGRHHQHEPEGHGHDLANAIGKVPASWR